MGFFVDSLSLFSRVSSLGKVAPGYWTTLVMRVKSSPICLTRLVVLLFWYAGMLKAKIVRHTGAVWMELPGSLRLLGSSGLWHRISVCLQKPDGGQTDSDVVGLVRLAELLGASVLYSEAASWTLVVTRTDPRAAGLLWSAGLLEAVV